MAGEGSVTVSLRNKASGQQSSPRTLTYQRGTTLGWSAGGGTVTDIQRQTAAYGPPAVIRLFSPPGSGIMPWTSAVMSAIPRNAVLIYSIKDWPTNVRNWLTSRPSTWNTPFYFSIDHEPEQGTSAGDPDPACYKQEWGELIAQLDGHQKRDQIRLLPIFTEYYAKRNASTFWNDFGVVASYSGIEAIGFDVYDGSSTLALPYRTPVERNAVPLQYARRPEVRKPLIIAEWGIERRTADTDGASAAKAVRDNMAYLRKQSDVPYVSWWHQAGDALWDRPNETQAFKDVIALNP